MPTAFCYRFIYKLYNISSYENGNTGRCDSEKQATQHVNA